MDTYFDYTGKIVMYVKPESCNLIIELMEKNGYKLLGNVLLAITHHGMGFGPSGHGSTFPVNYLGFGKVKDN